MGGLTPIAHFTQHYRANYKTVDEVKQDEMGNDKDGADEELEEGSDSDADMEDAEPEPEDSHATTPDFKKWLVWTGANCSYMRCLLKVADRVDRAGGDEEGDSSDGMFEDIDIDSDPEEPSPVIDIDHQNHLKVQALQLINLQHVLAMTEPLPQLSGFSTQAETCLEEIQESAFSIVTSLLFSSLPQVKTALLPQAVPVVQAVERYIKIASYKCDRLSAENACECLQKVVQES